MALDTLDKALKAASPGSTIKLPADATDAQTTTFDPSKENATQRVIVECEGRSIPKLEVLGTQHVEFRNLKITGLWNVRPSTGNSWTDASKAPKDLVFDNIDAKTFLLRNFQDSVIKNSQIGGWDASITPLGPPKIGAYPHRDGKPSVLSKNVLIENCLFHDMLRTIAGTAHAEGFYFDAGVDGFIMRGCFFTNCAVFDIFSNGPIGDRIINDVLIENCLLDVARDQTGGGAGSTINLKGGASNWIFRGNSILGQGGTLRNDSAPYPGFVFERNAIQNASFGWIGTAVWKDNVMSAPGSTGSKQADEVGFVSASLARCDIKNCYRNDLHVKPDSPAGLIGAGVPVDGTEPPPEPELPVRKLAEGTDYYLIGWNPVPDCTGYRISMSGKEEMPHTWNPAFQRDPNYPACNTRVEKGHDWYKIEALFADVVGEWRPVSS